MLPPRDFWVACSYLVHITVLRVYEYLFFLLIENNCGKGTAWSIAFALERKIIAWVQVAWRASSLTHFDVLA